MREHPSDDQLDRFLAGTLPAVAGSALLAHLRERCPECRRRLVRRAARALGLVPAAADPAADLEGYDTALERAFGAVRRQARDLAGERREVGGDLATLLAARAGSAPASDRRTAPAPERRTRGWALTEELLTLSRELRYRDPAAMVRFAELARLVVSSIAPEQYGKEPLADLEARVYAELANAYRVVDDLPEAESAMALAEARRRQGTGDLLLAARLLDLTASLRSDQRRFAEAVGLLRRAHALYLELGDRHHAGRALVSRGIYIGYSGDPEAALRLLLEGATLLDPARDPRLTFTAEQGIAWFLVELGRYAEARERLTGKDLAAILGDEPLSRVHLGWTEGRIALGLGDRRAAEAAFGAARDAFLAVGKPYNAALVALDLAATWLEEGRTAELKPLVGEVVATFHSLGIGREAMAALLLLEQACERDRATRDLVQGVLRFLARFEHDPSLTFTYSEPGPPA
jgi:tetratricopeptide (TPR) repeat protein